MKVLLLFIFQGVQNSRFAYIMNTGGVLMKNLVLVGNIDFVKILALKYGMNTPIGEIIIKEERLNESKSKRTIPLDN